ncbi:hypothetical protein FZEAL_6448 [Fusarium zealandicum]|uniref:Uncharacterized protein n=1 Tax=Fusarium zealandicum TaxID=1053134 RepID=A0A8H4XJL8_9HYPO|nr:hypothetical protein FZEAL_6448 [Fusarium zealandicum]
MRRSNIPRRLPGRCHLADNTNSPGQANIQDSPYLSSHSWSPNHRETSDFVSRHSLEGVDNYGGSSQDAEPLFRDMEDVSLSSDESSGEDSDWEFPSTEDAVLEDADSSPAQASTTQGTAPDSRASCVFDDSSMVVVEEDVDEWNNPPFDFSVPFGPRVQWNYSFEDLHPHASRALNLAHSLPGMQHLASVRDTLSTRAQYAQTSIVRTYGDVAEQVSHTAARTFEVVAVSAQVGGYLAGEAWTVGRNAAFNLQESWPEYSRRLNDGYLGRIGAFVREGMQALPPHDSIVRPRGRR